MAIQPNYLARGGDPYAGAAAINEDALGSIGTALFGNPQMAGQRALRTAQAENYGLQNEQLRRGLEYGDRLGADLAGAFTVKNPDGSTRPATFAEAAPRLGDLFKSAYWANNGDPAKTAGWLRAFTAMTGNEDLTRAGYAASGLPLGPDFAATTGRADEVQARNAKSDKDRATAVAGIGAGATVRAAQIGQDGATGRQREQLAWQAQNPSTDQAKARLVPSYVDDPLLDPGTRAERQRELLAPSVAGAEARAASAEAVARTRGDASVRAAQVRGESGARIAQLQAEGRLSAADVAGYWRHQAAIEAGDSRVAAAEAAAAARVQSAIEAASARRDAATTAAGATVEGARITSDGRLAVAGVNGDTARDVQALRNDGSLAVQGSRNDGALSVQNARNEGAATVAQTGADARRDVALIQGETARGVATTRANASTAVAELAAQGRITAGESAAWARVEAARASGSAQVAAADIAAHARVQAAIEQGAAVRAAAETGASARRDVATTAAGAVRDVAQTGAASREAVANTQGQTALAVQGARNDGALTVQGAKNEGALAVQGFKNEGAAAVQGMKQPTLPKVGGAEIKAIDTDIDQALASKKYRLDDAGKAWVRNRAAALFQEQGQGQKNIITAVDSAIDELISQNPPDNSWAIGRLFGGPQYGAPRSATPPAAAAASPSLLPQALPSNPAPPPAAIEMLRKNPSMAPQFDMKYGPGAADRALRGA